MNGQPPLPQQNPYASFSGMSVAPNPNVNVSEAVGVSLSGSETMVSERARLEAYHQKLDERDGMLDRREQRVEQRGTKLRKRSFASTATKVKWSLAIAGFSVLGGIIIGMYAMGRRDKDRRRGKDR